MSDLKFTKAEQDLLAQFYKHVKIGASGTYLFLQSRDNLSTHQSQRRLARIRFPTSVHAFLFLGTDWSSRRMALVVGENISCPGRKQIPAPAILLHD